MKLIEGIIELIALYCVGTLMFLIVLIAVKYWFLGGLVFIIVYSLVHAASDHSE